MCKDQKKSQDFYPTVKLGGVEFSLNNEAQIDESFLDKIIKETGLVEYTKGDSKPSLFLFTKDNHFKDWPYESNLAQTRVDSDGPVVEIFKNVTLYWDKRKPHFAFVLGHEIEHLKVILQNREFHEFACWCYNAMLEIYAKAGMGKVPYKQWDWPLELHCHRQGKKVAIALFGEEMFQNCLKDLKRVETPEYKETLDFILALEGQPYRDNICESILSDILELCHKYDLGKAIRQVWDEHRKKPDTAAAASQFELEKFIPHTES